MFQFNRAGSVFCIMVFLFCTPFLSSIALGQTLSQQLVARVEKGVFEVVVPKIKKGRLEYEKELPFDNLPYAERIDEYHSIGSAFLYKDNLFCTAAHVLNLSARSQFDRFLIRDQNGQVYEITDILSYSAHRDFVLFRVRGGNFPSPFEWNLKVDTNMEIFTVGNALGEGVVIRNGLLTSRTYEEQDGAWKWLRFSAAASPGNSGGPLLDSEGRVVGLVLRKSPNENLNFALPLEEIAKHSENKAEINTKMKFDLLNSPKNLYGRYERRFDLPRSLHALREEISSDFEVYYSEKMRELFQKYKDQIFPEGPGSRNLLNRSVYPSSFLSLISENEYGDWDFVQPKQVKRIPIGRNGYVSFGVLEEAVFTCLERPDNTSVQELYSDSRRFMDIMLRALYLTRGVGNEQIKIVSLGEAFRSEQHTDRFGRKWIIRKWNMDFNDQVLSAISLPVPDGMVSILFVGPTGYNVVPDFKILSDFLCVDFKGTFFEWYTFFDYSDLIPESLKSFSFKFRPREIMIDTESYHLNYDSDLLTISPKNILNVGFAFRRYDSSVRLELTRLSVLESRTVKNYFSLTNYVKPESGMGDAFDDHWHQLSSHLFPYNDELIYKEGYTQQYHVIKTDSSDPQSLITLKFNYEGNKNNTFINNQVNRFLDNFKMK